MAANENQTITSIIFRYSIQCHFVNVSTKLVKINPNMSIENAFRRSDSMLNSRSVTPPPWQNGCHFTHDIFRCISVPNRRQTIIWSSADPIQRRIYAALWEDELTLIVVHTRDNIYIPASFAWAEVLQDGRQPRIYARKLTQLAVKINQIYISSTIINSGSNRCESFPVISCQTHADDGSIELGNGR